MTDAILCVDDELSVLATFQRQFRKQFNIVSALNGTHALQTLATKGPFAVVMTDFNMPGMNGLAFLERVREQSPQTVRLMLSGRADAETGIGALNSGTVFRFLSKPCSPETLAAAFTSALEQYRLVVAEPALRAQMKESGLALIAEVQRFLPGTVIARAKRIFECVQALVSHLKICDIGPFDIAAKLSHVGCIGISGQLIEKAFNGCELSVDETAAFRKHAEIGARIIDKVPGLDAIAATVRGQFEVNAAILPDKNFHAVDAVLLGAQLLRLAGAYDSLQRRFGSAGALEKLSFALEAHNPILLDALDKAVVPMGRSLAAHEVAVGMTTHDSVVSAQGVLLAPKGVPITAGLLAEIRRHADAGELEGPIRVVG